MTARLKPKWRAAHDIRDSRTLSAGAKAIGAVITEMMTPDGRIPEAALRVRWRDRRDLIRTIMASSGRSRATVYRALAELEAAGIIDRRDSRTRGPLVWCRGVLRHVTRIFLGASYRRSALLSHDETPTPRSETVGPRVYVADIGTCSSGTPPEWRKERAQARGSWPRLALSRSSVPLCQPSAAPVGEVFTRVVLPGGRVRLIQRIPGGGS